MPISSDIYASDIYECAVMERETKLQKLEWRQVILGRGSKAFKVTLGLRGWVGIL